MTDPYGHRPDRSPPPGWERWTCRSCAAQFDEPTSLPHERAGRCPQCWLGAPHWSVLVEQADGTAPCTECRAPIRWVTTTATRTWLPLDAAPDPVRGNVIVDRRRHAGVLSRAQAAAARAAGRPLYRHHRTSCPYAARWARSNGTA